MWQRIQTLFLAISTALVAAMFFCFKADEITYTSYWPYTVFLVVITLLNLLALGCFKFRIFQMRTAVLSAILTIAFQAWLVVDFVATHNDVIFHVSAVFPFAAFICDLLAARNIFSDELMVRSASRLRSSKRKH